jgi:AraC-like DNA-binding protein
VPYEWQQYVRHLLQIVQMNVGTAPPQPLDRLSALLRRFEVRAGVFRTGIICGVAENDGQDPSGRLHILRGGRLRVTGGDAPPIDLTEPSVLFFPRGLPHRLDTGGPEREAEILCARIDLGGATSPLVAALPEVIALPLAASDGMRATLEVLVEEAFTMNCGRQAVLDRLCEVVVVKLLRHVIGRGEARFGMLAGLSHPTLRHALTAIHESPERPWTLERLADAAGMSRTAFANTFRDVVGETPGSYVTQWRLSLAKEQIAKGVPMKAVARAVGYASPAALSRAYGRRFAQSARKNSGRSHD